MHPLLILAIFVTAPPARSPFSNPVVTPAPPISQPSPGGPAPHTEAEPRVDTAVLAGQIIQPLADQLAAQANATNAAIAQLAESVNRLAEAQAKSDDRRSADSVATKALLAQMVGPLPNPTAERPPTASVGATSPYQPGVRPAQSDCSASCPGPDNCSCPCAVALKATRQQLQAVQAKQAAPRQFAGQDDSGQWWWSNDHRSVAATVARENRRLRGEDVGDPASPVYVPVRQSTYAGAQASYSDVPTTYATVPVTYSAPVSSYAMPSTIYQSAPMVDTSFASASTVSYGSGGGGLFGGSGMFSGGGIFGGGLLSGGSCAGGSCR